MLFLPANKKCFYYCSQLRDLIPFSWSAADNFNYRFQNKTKQISSNTCFWSSKTKAGTCLRPDLSKSVQAGIIQRHAKRLSASLMSPPHTVRSSSSCERHICYITTVKMKTRQLRGLVLLTLAVLATARPKAGQFADKMSRTKEKTVFNHLLSCRRSSEDKWQQWTLSSFFLYKNLYFFILFCACWSHFWISF